MKNLNVHQPSIDYKCFLFSIQPGMNEIFGFDLEADTSFFVSGQSSLILKKLILLELLNFEEIEFIQCFPFIKTDKKCDKIELVELLANHTDFTEFESNEELTETYANDLEFPAEYPYRMT